MFLSEDEKRMLAGERGYPAQKAMEILVALGDSFGANEMVEVASCHLPGASVNLLGEAGIMFVEEMAAKGGVFRAFTTTNPTSCDSAIWSKLGIEKAYAEWQFSLTGTYQKLGALTCGSCTPYYIGHAPRFGEHAAWGESSAVAYINSVLGARTNREGGPSALAAAITGRVPSYGMHIKENRYGDLLVHVGHPIKGICDYGTLGYYVGAIAKQRIPVFTGISSEVTNDELKSLGSALASSGAVSLFHVVGVTPEAPTLESAFNGKKPEQILEYTLKEQGATEAGLNSEKTDHVDWLYIGCPQCSIHEVRHVANLLAGKRIHKDVELWVCTSTPIKTLAEQMGYAKIIADAGALLVCETCPAHAPNRAIAKKKGLRTITTDSAKIAHYAIGEIGFPSHYGSTEKVILSALNKKWVD